MDQFAVGQGKKGHAIFLNCGTLAFHLVPVILPGYRLVITNTNKKRGLEDSKYNERVGECQKAVEYLSQNIVINSLGEIKAVPHFSCIGFEYLEIDTSHYFQDLQSWFVEFTKHDFAAWLQDSLGFCDMFDFLIKR